MTQNLQIIEKINNKLANKCIPNNTRSNQKSNPHDKTVWSDLNSHTSKYKLNCESKFENIISNFQYSIFFLQHHPFFWVSNVF